MNESTPARTKEQNLAFLLTAYLLTNNQLSWRSLLGILSLLGSVIFCSNTAAQIVPDNTLGAESSTVKSDNLNGQAIDLIEGGATRDTNLFHSFAEFNIAAEKGAYFANPEGINNIFSRVTGSNPSQILGTLGVLGNSNLFLLNPNGIVFGENARLDVGGSFFASTADSLLFDNGFEFSGSNPEAPPLLTVNIPVGLGFRDNPGEIVNRSYVENSADENVGLEVAPGQNLTLVGGDINFERGQATARGGNIELGGLSAAGTVGISDDGSLNFPEAVARADISLSNGADVDVRGTGGGNITINSGNLTLEAGEFGSSFIDAGITADSTSADAQAGNIIVDVAGNITLNDSRIINQVDSGGVGNAGNITISTTSLEATNGGQVSTSTFGKGNAGNISLNVTDAVTISGFTIVDEETTRFSSLTNQVFEGAIGNAGNIEIKARSLSLEDGGFLSSSTSGQGNAGDITIDVEKALTLKQDGDIFSTVGNNAISPAGEQSTVTINTGSLFIADGDSSINTSTFGTGDAGNVTLNIDGAVNLTDGDIFSNVGSEAVGNIGNIFIEAKSVSLTDGAQLQAGIFSGGQGEAAGIISIKADDSISFAGTNIEGNRSGIFSDVEFEAVGDGSDIELSANSVVLNNAILKASNAGEGSAGDIKFDVDKAVTLANNGDIFSEVEASGVGDGGTVTINAGSLAIADGDSSISTSTFGTGDAGNVTLDVEGAVNITDGNIFSNVEAGGIGDGGTVTINSGSLSLTDSSQVIASTSGEGNAGSVIINATDAVTLDGGKNDIRSGILSNVEAGGVGNGGTVTINSDSLSVTQGGQIQTLVRAANENTSAGQGNAGNILIDVDGEVIFSGTGNDEFQFPSKLVSDLETGAKGNAGNIELSARSLSLENGASIDNSTSGQGNAGNISINVTDAVTISGFTMIDEETTRFSNLTNQVFEGAKGNAGNIEIKARSLLLEDGGFLSSSTFGKGSAGNVTLNVDRAVTLANNGDIFSNVEKGAVATEAKVGTVTINAGSLAIADGDSSISTSTFGTGDAGNVTLDVEGAVNITDGNIFSNVEAGGIGDGGTITINSDSLSVTQGGQIQTLVRETDDNTPAGQGNAGNVLIDVDGEVNIFGISKQTGNSSAIFSSLDTGAEGSAGNIEVTASSLTLENGASIDNSTSGEGNVGNVTLDVEGAVELIGGDIFSNIERGGQGDGGEINIQAESLYLTDGAQIQSGLRGSSEKLPGGRGNGGEINIDVRDTVTLAGVSESGLTSAIFTDVESGAIGNGGDINIKGRSLSLENGGQLNASTSGQGNAGNISLNVSDAVTIAGFTVVDEETTRFSNVTNQVFEGAKGNAGNIEIKVRSLSLEDGAEIDNSTSGQGNAGQVTINASDTISVDGEDSEGFVSGLFSAVNSEAEGDAGGININTSSLSLTNGGIIDASTYGQGNAGDVTVNASESILISGAIEITRSGLFTSAFISSGNGGDINVSTNQLTIKDGGTIEAGNFDSLGVFDPGTGQPGNINIEANSLSLNRGRIEATTQSEIGEAANINLTIAEDIFLKNNSLISARASGNANGGNVTINADNGSIVAFPNQNNDIIANAQRGNGGNINITTQAIFGLEERPSTPANQTNDIDASSEFGLQGTFSLNTPENEPIRSLIDIPENVVNPEDLINQNACKQGAQSKFIVTGKGGLPATPEQMHHSDEVEVGLVKPAMGTAAVIKDLLVAEDATKRIPAKGWIRNEKGEIFLVGYDPTVSNILPQPENLDWCQPRGD